MTTLILGANGPLGLACVRAVLSAGMPVLAGVQAPHRIPPALHDLREEYPALLRSVAWQPGQWSDATPITRAIIAELPIPPVQLDEPDEPTSELRTLSPSAVQQAVSQLVSPTLAALQLVARLRPARALVQASWLGVTAEKIRGGGYALASSYAAHLMLVRAASLDLQRAGVATIVGNAGRYRLDMAGPSFHADIDEVARGLIAALDSADAAEEPRFVDWRGHSRAW